MTGTMSRTNDEAESLHNCKKGSCLLGCRQLPFDVYDIGRKEMGDVGGLFGGGLLLPLLQKLIGLLKECTQTAPMLLIHRGRTARSDFAFKA